MELAHAGWAVDELGPALVAFLRPCAGVEAVVVANAGGVICAAAEYRGAGRAEAFAEIREKIRDSTAELLDRHRPGTLTPRAAADQIAHERLRQAAALRRKF
jgi:glutamate dehydrogenase (NAD(P)+)